MNIVQRKGRKNLKRKILSFNDMTNREVITDRYAVWQNMARMLLTCIQKNPDGSIDAAFQAVRHCTGDDSLTFPFGEELSETVLVRLFESSFYKKYSYSV